MRGIGDFPSDDPFAWSYSGEEEEFEDYAPIQPKRRGTTPMHLRYMAQREVVTLQTILTFGTPYDPDALENDRRDLDCEPYFRLMEQVYEEVRECRLFEEEYITVFPPRFGAPTIKAEVTQLGFKALLCAERDLLWHMGYARPDPKKSVSVWLERLETITFPGEAEFAEIEALRSPAYDVVRELIPETRRRLWQDRLSTSNYPSSYEWDRIRTLDLPGLLPLRPRLDEWQHTAWIRAFRVDRDLKDSLYQKAFALEGEAFADVRRLALERHVEAWVRKVQEVTSPDSKVFKEVEALPETHSLVKAEAFLQKMKCWTPLDEKGRRT